MLVQAVEREMKVGFSLRFYNARVLGFFFFFFNLFILSGVFGYWLMYYPWDLFGFGIFLFVESWNKIKNKGKSSENTFVKNV